MILLAALGLALLGIENPISLNTQQRTKLMELIKTDKDAKARFETLKRAADKALNDKPNPIRVIQGEGKLKTDPLAIKTRESLGDMRKMYFFAYTFAATGDTQYADKAREFILAWSQQIRQRVTQSMKPRSMIFSSHLISHNPSFPPQRKKVPRLGCAK